MKEHAIFVAHRHEDDALVGELKDLLNRNNCKVRDSSVTTKTPNNARAESYIKAVILGRRILRSGKVLVIISPDTKNHWWVDWEIQYAKKKGKRIVGIWAPGADNCDLPQALEEFADALVPWDASKIIDALEGKNEVRDPQGEPMAPRTIRRAACL